MARTPLQTLAAGWCLLMVVLLAIVQAVSATPPPLPLFLVFAGVWVFGAAMLWWVPLFGAIGTAAYGILLGVQLVAMHGWGGMNTVIALASFVATALAVAFLVDRRKRG